VNLDGIDAGRLPHLLPELQFCDDEDRQQIRISVSRAVRIYPIYPLLTYSVHGSSGLQLLGGPYGVLNGPSLCDEGVFVLGEVLQSPVDDLEGFQFHVKSLLFSTLSIEIGGGVRHRRTTEG